MQKVLSNGMVAFISEVDSDLLDIGWWWHGRYIRTKYGYLHRVIAERIHGGPLGKLVTDHINGDALNNTRSNLQVCTQSENVGKGKHKNNSKSGVRGVWQSRQGKWVAQKTRNGKRVHIGTFETMEAAKSAYDNLANKP